MSLQQRISQAMPASQGRSSLLVLQQQVVDIIVYFYSFSELIEEIHFFFKVLEKVCSFSPLKLMTDQLTKSFHYRVGLLVMQAQKTQLSKEVQGFHSFLHVLKQMKSTLVKDAGFQHLPLRRYTQYFSPWASSVLWWMTTLDYLLDGSS